MKTKAIKGMYLKKAQSKAGNSYTALAFDLGYSRYFITCQREKIAELLGLTVEQLIEVTSKMEIGDSIEVQIGE